MKVGKERLKRRDGEESKGQETRRRRKEGRLVARRARLVVVEASARQGGASGVGRFRVAPLRVRGRFGL